MADIARLDLCQELRERADLWIVDQDTNKGAYRYDAGFLLRKLPIELVVTRCTNGDWSCKANGITRTAVTPEDALCKLAIKLFKEGVLER